MAEDTGNGAEPAKHTRQWPVDHTVNILYFGSISGYHIAEAGANPISQLAFTLANGFTYVETYLGRGMKIDEFAPNLSFLFSDAMTFWPAAERVQSDHRASLAGRAEVAGIEVSWRPLMRRLAAIQRSCARVQRPRRTPTPAIRCIEQHLDR